VTCTRGKQQRLRRKRDGRREWHRRTEAGLSHDHHDRDPAGHQERDTEQGDAGLGGERPERCEEQRCPRRVEPQALVGLDRRAAGAHDVDRPTNELRSLRGLRPHTRVVRRPARRDDVTGPPELIPVAHGRRRPDDREVQQEKDDHHGRQADRSLPHAATLALSPKGPTTSRFGIVSAKCLHLRT